ncbi:hypothetical protein [Paracoccus marcusii]
MSVLLGLIIGMIAGFFRTADAIIMRAMDALMAIPRSCWPSRWWR